ncbi:flagellar filament capping protein FliD [Variovorax sp. EL159]|uniref:flagellar filament capping protein FliD n=1 Tax=unclassified Variovorax TaxID=663243 RepID=UPI0008820EAF|nr:flagellar filament capping protein FliD [Variovorax sp. EL159]SCX56158.1 flagellar hook-associated protein 2 [Variovorax sp. EL159]
MPTISSLGVGANLDLNTLLTKLQSVESQPLALLQQRQTSFTSKLSGYGQIQSALNGLQAAAKKLSDPAFFAGVKTTATPTDVLTASSTDKASAGTYNINVDKLAQAQSLVSGGLAKADTPIGVGTISIDFGAITGGTLDPATGTYTGATFTQDTTRTAVPISIGAGNNTLEGIRDAINNSKAGVKASIVNDGSGTPNRLVLVSAQSGEQSTMRVSVTGDAALQNLLGNDPAGTQNLRQTVAGQDAKLTVNGIAVTSASNTVKEAIQGTTLNLLKRGDSVVTALPDTANVSTAISDFVKAYNTLQSTAGALTAYNKDTNTASPLTGDSTLRNLLSRVRQTIVSPQDTGPKQLKVLTEIGVSLQKDGTLSIDQKKLDAAINTNLDGVTRLFATGIDSKAGYGKQLTAVITDLTSIGGALKTASDGVTTTLKQLDSQYTAMKEHVDSTVERYRKQFNQLDVVISGMNNTLSYLTTQFNALTSNKGK